MAKDLAIVLNDGGLNAAVATALAAQRYRPILLNATRSEAGPTRRRMAYDQQVGHFKPFREHTLAMPFLAAIETVAPVAGGGADPRSGSPLSPRLLDLFPIAALAARFAAHYQVAAVYMGLRIGPDPDDLARATEFGQILNELIQGPCGQGEVEITLPLLELEPWQVVDVGFQVGAPFDKTWSCESDAPEPCWACRGCRAREQSFQQAGKPDPLRIAKRG